MRRRALGAAILLSLVAAGCGYALVGRGLNIDPSIKRIGVPAFVDHTGRAGLDQRITQKVIEELQNRGHFEVVESDEDVDAIVSGEILSYNETPVGFAADASDLDLRAQASRYEIRLVAKVSYAKVGAEEPIWSNDSFSVGDNYEISDEGDGLVDSDQALERLATTFARQMVAGMLEAF
jgi:hypothetical protein